MPRPHSLLGKPAPSFTLTNFNGEAYTFTPGSTGRPAAVFFYPKSGAFVSTREACQFRDYLLEKDLFKTSNVQIIGISPDSVEKQKDFVEKQNLNYPVLSDSKGDVRRAYEVHRGLLGLNESVRLTFFIDASGVVKDVYSTPLNVGNHVKFVHRSLARLAGEPMTDDMMSDTISTPGTPVTATSMEAALSGDMNNTAPGLPTYAATIEQNTMPTAPSSALVLPAPSIGTPIFDQMTADRMVADSMMSSMADMNMPQMPMSASDQMVDTTMAGGMVSDTMNGMINSGGPPGIQPMSASIVDTSSSMSSTTGADSMQSTETSMASPLLSPMTAQDELFPIPSKTKVRMNNGEVFPISSMEQTINHMNTNTIPGASGRCETMSLGDTSVRDMPLSPAVSVGFSTGHHHHHHHHNGAPCECYCQKESLADPILPTMSRVELGNTNLPNKEMTSTPVLDVERKMTSSFAPTPASEDPLAISILAMLGIRERERLQQKAIVDESALQSLLAVYGLGLRREDTIPEITDPLALSIIAAARSGSGI